MSTVLQAAAAAAQKAEPLRKILLINAHFFLRVTVGCTNMASEPVQAVAICGGDATAAMQMLASSSALSGLLQWALNPTFGKLSDIYGRKPFLMIGPSTNCLFNCLIATNPTNRRLFVALRVLGNSFQTLSGSTTSMAALADCCSGDRLTIWSAWMSSAACVGVIMGGWIEALILFTGRGTRTVYLTMSAMGALHTALVALLLQETLPAAERSKDPPRLRTPLGMLRLFTNGARLRLASLSCGFGCFADGTNLNDIDQMWIKQDVPDMGMAANSVYLTFWGLAGSISGFIIPAMLKTLGAKGFTTVTNFTNFLACTVWGGLPFGPTRRAIFAGLALHTPGIDGNAGLCVKTEATEAAVAAGMGRGEFAGYYGSLRALTVAIGPYIFGNLYAWGRTSRWFVDAAGKPRFNIGFFAAALLGCVVPEIFHQLLLRAKRRDEKEARKA